MHPLKVELRNQIKQKIIALTPDQKSEYSKQANIHLLEFLYSRRYKNILLSHSLPDEIDTLNFLKNNIQKFNFYLPKVNVNNESLGVYPILNLKTDLIKGKYDIYEPNTSEEMNWRTKLDSIVIPARALDIEGNRLGRGKGYYDHFLSNVLKNHTTIVCMIYHCQLISEVPVESFDVPIEYCITEKGVFHLRRKLL